MHFKHLRFQNLRANSIDKVDMSAVVIILYKADKIISVLCRSHMNILFSESDFEKFYKDLINVFKSILKSRQNKYFGQNNKYLQQRKKTVITLK